MPTKVLGPNVGSVSVANTSTALSASATFTGSWVRVQHPMAFLRGLVFADVRGTLYVDHSDDGSTIRLEESIAILGDVNNGTGFKRHLLGEYVRVRFINDNEAQSTFSLNALQVQT